MLSRLAGLRALSRSVNSVPQRGFAKAPTGRKVVSRSPKARSGAITAPPTAALSIADSWVAVDDKAGGKYYWNTVTNETTELGAPKPTGETALAPAGAAQGGGIMAGVGGMVAQGFAFGVGSSVAHSVVGSLFGGGGGGDSGGDGGGDGGDGGSWDV
jgi:hypothetical protein